MVVCLVNISTICTLLIAVMRFVPPSKCAYVSWSVQSNPAVFYSTVYLKCEIPNDFNDCKKSTKQWLGGMNYGSLCYGTDCRGSRKYSIMNSTCLYVLKIEQFSEDDFNCEYTCSYGVANMRKKLTEQAGRFRYYPQHYEVIERSYMQGNTVDLTVNLTKVFPIPQNCSASINGGNVSDVDALLNWTEPSFFYEVELMMKLPVTLCKVEASISCSWDSTDTKNVTSINYDYCEVVGGRTRTNTSDVVVGLICGIIGGVLTSAVLICFFTCRKVHAKHHCMSLIKRICCCVEPVLKIPEVPVAARSEQQESFI